MDKDTYLSVIEDALEDVEKHVNFKWLAGKLEIPANNAKRFD
jgi:hypothetical protein